MEDVSAVAATNFGQNYRLHLKHLKLKGLQPKTIEAYSRAIRRLRHRPGHFDYRLVAMDFDLDLPCRLGTSYWQKLTCRFLGHLGGPNLDEN